MTNRLYYPTSDLHEFDSVVQEIVPASPEQPRPGVILRETAFYPTSGGQVHDSGWLTTSANDRVPVAEVTETEDGRIVHYLEAPANLAQRSMETLIPNGAAITCSSTPGSTFCQLLSSSSIRYRRFPSTWEKTTARLI